jgi:hypothetical protein
MAWKIEIYVEGMPQSMDEDRSPNYYGPYASEEAAEKALKRRGWSNRNGNWYPGSCMPGDRRCAEISEIEKLKLRKPKQLPVG